ncbi:MAG: ergothioneine biosynthesis protein EgtB [Proteobacteria bacterium]|nr:ergothioneine biosynthesis protein EgtB [Pseudomonadota bacterium]NOG61605.1 ergothioneine biosynthesis protein EgtB [Pseudomonadota bacterium]
MKQLLEELQSLQNEVINIVSSVPEKNYSQQFHPDLSPIGWHLGHCVYTETYWIREQLHGQQTIDNSLKSLYIPELSKKQYRGAALPEKTELLEWAQTTQSENCELLASIINEHNSHQLLENNYLIYFLIQHYSQHIETMVMVLTEMQLQKPDFDYTNTNNLKPEKLIPKTQTIDAGRYEVGLSKMNFAYDNEQPSHSVKLHSYNIATKPVSNSEYLQFINDDVYNKKTCWSDEGWQWINATQYKYPHHWRIANDSIYYGVNHDGAYSLENNAPVHGLSFYEAEAFANWRGARLPHEHEWEIASIKNIIKQTGLAWEWCNNTFYPYHDFSPYPYEGYSLPYFDGKHYVLRGGSRHTKGCIKRTSFRNYYTADKRHIFAGLRLIYD